MDYVERYMNGEFEKVWSDLQSLGPSVRNDEFISQAQFVAAETMARVRRNCETIIARLKQMGYFFDRFPDGSRRTFMLSPLTPASDQMRADMSELEIQTGPLPLSLVSFWNTVGAVELVGMHPDWPDGLDPLVIYPPEGALSMLYDPVDGDPGSPVFACLAPDDLHKDNVSGGDPYGVDLPNASADFIFRNERHGIRFIPYLRLAILDWGGFPGLDEETVRFDPLSELTDGLEEF